MTESQNKRKHQYEYWTKNKASIQEKQRNYRANQRASEPWHHTFFNHRAAAKRGEYLDTTITDWKSTRALYQRAHNMGSSVVMIVSRKNGGLYTPSNLKVKEVEESK
jgi:hypothetical protein